MNGTFAIFLFYFAIFKNLLSTSKCFLLFETIILAYYVNLVVFTDSAIIFFLAKFASFSHASKLSDFSLLNSRLVVYLLQWSWSSFFIILTIFVLLSAFLMRVLNSDI